MTFTRKFHRCLTLISTLAAYGACSSGSETTFEETNANIFIGQYGSSLDDRHMNYATTLGNFDDDPDTEFAIFRQKSPYNGDTHRIEVYDLNKQAVAATSLDDVRFKTDTGSGGRIRTETDIPLSIASGDLDGIINPDDEIVVAYEVKKGKPGEGAVALKVFYRKAGALKLWAATQMGDNGNCGRWGCRPVVATGNFNNDQQKEIVVAKVDGSRRPTLLVYDLKVDPQGNAKLVRTAELRLGAKNNCAGRLGCKPSVAVGNFDNDSQDEILLSHEDAQGRVVLQVFDVSRNANNQSELSLIGERRLGAQGQRRRDRDAYAWVAAGNFRGDHHSEAAVYYEDDAGDLQLRVYDFDLTRPVPQRFVQRFNWNHQPAFLHGFELSIHAVDVDNDGFDDLTISHFEVNESLRLRTFSLANGVGQLFSKNLIIDSDDGAEYLSSRLIVPWPEGGKTLATPQYCELSLTESCPVIGGGSGPGPEPQDPPPPTVETHLAVYQLPRYEPCKYQLEVDSPLPGTDALITHVKVTAVRPDIIKMVQLVQNHQAVRQAVGNGSPDFANEFDGATNKGAWIVWLRPNDQNSCSGIDYPSTLGLQVTWTPAP